MRVDAWYRSGNLAPERELSLWRLHPEAELRKLGADLRAGTWKPSVWPQLPYPKKGARLRHYTLPTVTDQVAFMAYMVLLGPLLDSRVANFAFGNRWYRPIIWNRRRAKPRWEFRPYPLLTTRCYRPYAWSHGLYRRVANWTVAQMTQARLDEEDYSGAVHHPVDYSDEALPAWVRKEWWLREETEDERAAWATLDVELAFPSVDLDRLLSAGKRMLGGLMEPVSGLLIGYPQSIREILDASDCRRQLIQSLVEGLQAVDVEDESVPRDAWKPFHATPRLPPDNKGLPTGLAISGMLLNVALHDTDRSVVDYLECLRKQPADRRGAFLRFADDMIVLSRSARGLMDLIEAVWRGLADDDSATLAVPKSRSNLYLGVEKISPNPVRDLVRRYLCDQGWTECQARGCDQLGLKNNLADRQSLGEWWTDRFVDKPEEEYALLGRRVDRSTVGSREVGPFITTLVTRMSDIAKDTLSERFGEGARNRLVQLHDLARLDIEDLQVRAETRRAFAVNRLVRAWLPGERDDVVGALSEIRESIGQVLQLTPWKYSIWRTVVRAAARRPPASSDQRANDDYDAAQWLSTQLRRIAHHKSGPNDRTSCSRCSTACARKARSTAGCSTSD